MGGMTSTPFTVEALRFCCHPERREGSGSKADSRRWAKDAERPPAGGDLGSGLRFSSILTPVSCLPGLPLPAVGRQNDRPPIREKPGFFAPLRMTSVLLLRFFRSPFTVHRSRTFLVFRLTSPVSRPCLSSRPFQSVPYGTAYSGSRREFSADHRCSRALKFAQGGKKASGIFFNRTETHLRYRGKRSR